MIGKLALATLVAGTLNLAVSTSASGSTACVSTDHRPYWYVSVCSNVCVSTGTATFIDSAVWYPDGVPLGLGAAPASGANRGTFSLSGACTETSASLSGSFVFPNGAQCGRSAGGSGTLDDTGKTFSIDTLATVVLITGEVTAIADATPLLGTSCRADQGGTKNFTLVGAITL